MCHTAHKLSRVPSEVGNSIKKVMFKSFANNNQQSADA